MLGGAHGGETTIKGKEKKHLDKRDPRLHLLGLGLGFFWGLFGGGGVFCFFWVVWGLGFVVVFGVFCGGGVWWGVVWLGGFGSPPIARRLKRQEKKEQKQIGR